MTDRHHDPIVQQVGQALDSRSGLRGLKKNGHTWAEWLLQNLSLERMLLLVIAIYTIGGNVADAQHDIKEAVQKAEDAIERVERAGQTLAEAQRKHEEVVSTQERLATELAAVKDGIAQAVKRGEFRSAIQQQILPRLERIERRIGPMP